MEGKQETSADIIAEFRGYAAGMPPSYHVTMSWHDFRVMLDRLEAAHRRELGDAAKEVEDLKSRVKLWTDRADELRKKCDEFYARAKTTGDSAALLEALELARLYISLSPEAESRAHVKNGQIEMLHAIDVLDKISAALSAPARNCDVGTAEEQSKRCFAYCKQYICKDCPCNTVGRCSLVWAQMPYESEVEK